MDLRPERREQLDERVVLALGDVEVDRVQEAVGRVVEGGPEGRTGSLDQHVAQRRDHRLGAVGTIGHDHRMKHTVPARWSALPCASDTRGIMGR